MRRRDDHSRGNRYGGSRVDSGLYDRKPALTWRQKSLREQKGYRMEPPITSRDIVPYEHSTGTGSDGKQSSEAIRSPKAPLTRRLVSTIVTPSRVDLHMEENVTKRDKQIIGALSDMEIADQHDGEMMECYVRDDNLLGAGGMVQNRMPLWALRVGNLRFFVGDLLGSVRHRLRLMQENQGVTTKVQKSLEVFRQQVMVLWVPKIHPTIRYEDTQLELSRDWERPHSLTPYRDVSEASPMTCVPF
ncbi:hypothetical protein Bca52824_058224 [Brassica carinata]|uniref:Uncharacterized protein n=1 Tax=Brassica carinata TaxID=52824 RepID=A0A8X7UEI5_BRACI|nr:hypothetical protein Bca52824_058224 [Brassica carinata]